MFLKKIADLTINKFIIIEERVNGAGYIYELSRYIVNGHSLWSGEGYRIVIPFQFLFAILAFQGSTLSSYLFLYKAEVNWFKGLLSFAILSSLLVCIALNYLHKDDIQKLSLDVDRWWSYSHMDQEVALIKRDHENKLKWIQRYYFYITFVVASGYVLIPTFVKFMVDGSGNPSDWLVLEGLPEQPWVYLEIFGGIVATHSAFVCSCNYALYLIVVIYTAIVQLRVAGIALLSVQRRTLKLMENGGMDLADSNIYEKLVNVEIKSCAMHYQAIYRQTTIMFRIIETLTNETFYVGCFCFVTSTILFIKGTNNQLKAQMFVMVAAVIGFVYLFSFIGDSLLEETANLRFTLYSSEWYKLPISAQKSLHIMQTMLMYCPQMTTIFGNAVTSEYFSKVMNAGYCYITAILSMSNDK